jgi:hypothetical protein
MCVDSFTRHTSSFSLIPRYVDAPSSLGDNPGPTQHILFSANRRLIWHTLQQVQVINAHTDKAQSL